MRFRPHSLVGFDEAETPLFHLDREMAKRFPDVAFYPEIGTITRRDTLKRVMQHYHPSILYHAAAYKHVPMMEKHVFAAVETNVFGTWNVARTATEHGVEDFVMISTDKAVRPTSMMGATKRMAELLIRGLQMEGGEVFVLEMGEPVKIADLARNLILLSGLQPERDIEIQFIGLRPGEKMYEELNLRDENLIPTSHAKIRSYVSHPNLDATKIKACLNRLQTIAEGQDVGNLVLLMKEMIPDYNPGSELLRTAMSARTDRPIRIVKVSAPLGLAETHEEVQLTPASLLN